MSDTEKRVFGEGAGTGRAVRNRRPSMCGEERHCAAIRRGGRGGTISRGGRMRWEQMMRKTGKVACGRKACIAQREPRFHFRRTRAEVMTRRLMSEEEKRAGGGGGARQVGGRARPSVERVRKGWGGVGGNRRLRVREEHGLCVVATANGGACDNRKRAPVPQQGLGTVALVVCC